MLQVLVVILVQQVQAAAVRLTQVEAVILAQTLLAVTAAQTQVAEQDVTLGLSQAAQQVAAALLLSGIRYRGQ